MPKLNRQNFELQKSNRDTSDREDSSLQNSEHETNSNTENSSQDNSELQNSIENKDHLTTTGLDKKACDSLLETWNVQNIHLMDSKECATIEQTCQFSCNSSVDAMYLWVDGADPEWKAKKDRVLKKLSAHEKSITGKSSKSGNSRL